MKPNKQTYYTAVFFLFSLIIFLSYSNTFNVSWHLDDDPNILGNYYLHLESITIENLINTLYTNVNDPHQLSETLYRPVACLTFALNWYFGKDQVFGYHLVNIIIHILTAFILFLFINTLLKIKKLKSHEHINPIAVAFLASLLWATNPIQTQAVTYIVQRMAQFAALFYIIGMYAYLKGRLNNSVGKRLLWYLICLISYPLAVYSKSNAVILPLAILMVEIIFLQDWTNKKNMAKNGIIALVIIMFILLFGTLAFLKGNPLSFLETYNHRAFTLTERLLAEPRIVVLYLSQIFFPSPERFSIAHDIPISSSFTQPWTTIPCILLIFGLNGFAVFQIKKRPLLSFSILFFFLNHIIESSVIALELVFEHRNYLPSFFLFLPLAYAINYVVKKYWYLKREISIFAVLIALFLVAGFSYSTYIRNKAWENGITLWTDAISKAPNNARASNILAIKLAWGEESTHPQRYDMALKLFEESLNKHLPSKYMKADILGNMASIYFYNKNQQKKAITLYKEALNIAPDRMKIRRDLASALILMRNFRSAAEQVDILIAKKNTHAPYHNLKGFIFLWEKNYPEALVHFKKAFNLTPGGAANKINIMLNSGVALSLSGKHESAEKILLKAIQFDPANIACYFALIENSIRMRANFKTKAYVQKLFNTFEKSQISYELDNLTDNPKLAPISKEILGLVLSEK